MKIEVHTVYVKQKGKDVDIAYFADIEMAKEYAKNYVGGEVKSHEKDYDILPQLRS